ncbi:unnamed protein product [Cyprideis torosa]|uniref:Penicillin-binding protein 1A n=1 Tax=Cyprideis torosa TaxID=163714 RepID=A0A7R8ZU58_9CRUS|nr:unnamed protein product [Cyprideis torosa]CAG0905346.1 unnamed protein product [Cyprideis torosa]
MRMEKALSKDQILELYLNEIFLGQRAYGVAAAALAYFNKSLDELTIEEVSYLAALPKAPNNYHPVRKYDAALERRNWVIGRMQEDGYITKAQADIAQAKPLKTEKRKQTQDIEAGFFAEEIRRELKEKYGQQSLYQGGLAVRSSVDPKLQNIAVQSLRDGLRAYDERHGWRGPIANLSSMDDWAKKLSEIAVPEGMLSEWQIGVVLSANNNIAEIAFANKEKIQLKLDGVRWARKCLQDCYALGQEVIKVSQVVKKGDVVMVESVGKSWILRQVPKVQGAIIALDPHTGRVLAMQGGWTQSASSFNRATQAQRQPGSAFKPFVYLAALDNGFTPSTKVLDAPFVIEQAPGKRETGSSVAAPIWGDFMKEALKDEPPMPFRVPAGIKNVRVNAKTGRLAQAGDKDTIWEAFVAGTEPGSGNFADSADVIGEDGSIIKQYNSDPYGYDDSPSYGEEFVDDVYDNVKKKKIVVRNALSSRYKIRRKTNIRQSLEQRQYRQHLHPRQKQILTLQAQAVFIKTLD